MRVELKFLLYNIGIIGCSMAAGAILASMYFMENPKVVYIEKHEIPLIDTTDKEEIPVDWEIFKESLIQIESGGVDTIVNKYSGAYGLYQIMPKGGYLCEYNRLRGTELTLEDLKSVFIQDLIFDYIQKVKNPEQDLKKALMIHNPGAMDEHYITPYEYSVMYWYYKKMYEKLLIDGK